LSRDRSRLKPASTTVMLRLVARRRHSECVAIVGAWAAFMGAWVAIVGAWVAIVRAWVAFVGAWVAFVGAWLAFVGAGFSRLRKVAA
jgi:hypothetical protein